MRVWVAYVYFMSTKEAMDDILSFHEDGKRTTRYSVKSTKRMCEAFGLSTVAEHQDCQQAHFSSFVSGLFCFGSPPQCPSRRVQEITFAYIGLHTTR